MTLKPEGVVNAYVVAKIAAAMVRNCIFAEVWDLDEAVECVWRSECKRMVMD